MKNIAKLQKWSFIVLFIMTIILFIYCTGYFTAFQFVENDSQEFYDKAQNFNKLLFTLSFSEIIIAALALAFDNHKRRKYYLSNKILGFASAITCFGTAIFLLINSFTLKKMYIGLPTTVRDIFLALQGGFELKTTTFNIGILVAIFLILSSMLVCYTVIVKITSAQKNMATGGNK